MRDNEKRTVQGRIDSDSHSAAVNPGDYRHALNFLNVRRSARGSGINFPGNEIISYDGLPVGSVKVIGSVEDKIGQSIIYFVWSQNQDHVILQYLSQEVSLIVDAPGRVIELLRGSFLNFSENRRIQARIVDRQLVWTDALGDYTDISGNEVRRIDITKARLDSKYLEYELYADIEGRNQFLSGTQYTIYTTDLDGTAGSTPYVFTADASHENSPLGLNDLADGINSNIPDLITAEKCDGCKITLHSVIPERRIVVEQGPSAGFSITLNLVNCSYLDGVSTFEFAVVPSAGGFDVGAFEYLDGVWTPATFLNPNYQIITDATVSINIRVSGTNDYGETFFTFFDFGWSNPGDPCGTYTLAASPPYVSGGHIVLVPINHYHQSIGSEHITLIKQPPACPPTTEFFSDEQYIGSNVVRGCWQFRSRFVYRDGDRSAWSAISMVSLPIAFDGNVVDSMNAILIDFTDSKLDDAVWLGLIETVEIAVRDGNDNEFYFARRLPVCEVGRNLNGATAETATGNSFVFSNSEIYSIVESDDLSIPASGQVLKLFDWIPPNVQAIETISDEEGNTRIVLGGMKETYECPDCVSIDFAPAIEENADLITIRGTVEIINNALHPDANPDYLRYDLQGFVVYLAGTNYYGVSNNPEDGSGDGSFEITGVPKGVYIMRVAGYTTSLKNEEYPFGSPVRTLNKPRECLINGLEWQRTSAPVIDCAGSVAETTIPEERVLDLTAASGVFDLDIEAGYGTIQIQNAHSSETDVGIIEVYVVDSNEDLSASDDEADLLSSLASGIAVERLRVTFPIDGGGTEDKDTDHNGYAWISTEVAALSDIGAVGLDDMLLFDASTQTWGYPYTEHFVPLSPATSASGVFANTAIDKAEPTNFFIWINRTQAWTTANRRTLSGVCTGQNGQGVSGVLVAYTRNGRQERTDVFGNYAIAVYPPNGGASGDPRHDDVVIVTYENDVTHLYPPTPDHQQAIDIDPWADYVVDPFVFGFNGGVAQASRYYKAGGAYNMGIVYEDDAGRSCGVSPAGIARTLFFTELGSISKQQIEYTINHRPPIWATRWRFVRSKNTIHQNYYPWATQEVKFGIITNPNIDPTFTDFSANNWTHLFIKVNLADVKTAAEGLLLFFQEFTSGYTPSKGDRVRFITDATQVSTPLTQLIDVNVAGRYIKDDSFYVVVERVELPSEPGNGWLFEFYTPNLVHDEIYYETGDCFDVLNPGSESQSHEGGTQDQSSDLTTPATGILSGGDTYWRFKTYTIDNTNVSTWMVEHRTISKYHRYACEDIGRAWVHDPGAGERYYKERLRFGGIYSPRARRSNLSSFGALDYKAINLGYGQIKCIVMVRETMLVLGAFKSQPVYVGKARVTDMSQAQLIGRSDQVLNIANETIHDAGTLNPESVVVQDGMAYFWDVYHGTVWSFGPNGMNEMDYGKVNYFRAIGKERIRISRDTDFTPAGFDRRYGLYLLTFSPGVYYVSEADDVHVAEQATWAFDTDDESKGWKTELSFLPDFYAVLGNRLFTFAAGALYEHDTDASVPCTFYDSEDDFSLTLELNAQAAMIKTPQCLRIYGNGQYHVSAVTIPANASYPSGMASRIPANRFVKREGAHWAPFLRDQSGPGNTQTEALLKGRLLKYNTMRITISVLDSQENCIFVAADVEFVPSMDTKP
jgi:hypothetical protein